MVELSEKFKLQIINRYGKQGTKWLSNINQIIEKYTYEFQLKNTKLVDGLGVNIVLFSTSEQYGEVVLKIIAPYPSSNTEIQLMQQYPPSYIPKCYYFNLRDRIMVQERLLPGYSLDNLNNKTKRVKIFSNIANSLLLKNDGEDNFLTYSELFKDTIKYAYDNKETFSDMMWMIEKANNIYNKIAAMNLPQYILHGDLHHKNILKSKNKWKAIDPHGMIGEKVFESSQFIRNELEIFDTSLDNFEELILLIEKYLGEDKQLIMQSLYVTIISKIIGYVKNKYDTIKILYNINLAKRILEYLCPVTL